MSRKLIEKLRKDRDDYRATAMALLDRMESGDELSDADNTNLAEAQRLAAELDTRIGTLTEAETARLRAEQRDHELNGLWASTETVSAQTEQAPTLGAAFVASRAFKGYTGSGSSEVFAAELSLIKSVDPTGKPFAGVTRVADAARPQFATPLLDACGFEPVSTNSFDYLAWPLPPKAGEVAEGAVKGEAVFAPELKSGTLGKAAHHIPLTTEILEDLPRIQAIVEGALINGVRSRAEAKAAQALAGANLATVTDTTLLRAIRKGAAQVQMIGADGTSSFTPNAVVVNPLDYAEIDIELLEKTLAGARRESPVWGLTVVPAGIVPAGTAYVGDLRSAVTVFARSLVNLRMTDSHGEEFTSNILRILAEQRLSVIVTQPAAVVECTAG